MWMGPTFRAAELSISMVASEDWVCAESRVRSIFGESVHQTTRRFGCNPARSTSPTEHGRCLDAFIVALGQARAGGEKRWYASTLELQLVSLEFCKACRGIPILSVRVDDRTPCSLWFFPRPRSGLNTGVSKKARTSSRVPVVRALRLT